LHPDLLKNTNVTIELYNKKTEVRGLPEDEAPFPVSSRIGPYIVEDPIFGAKNYYWCACGMSKSEPFCDKSHKGTAFKPIKFSLDQRADKIYLCGCKFTTKAPFCKFLNLFNHSSL